MEHSTTIGQMSKSSNPVKKPRIIVVGSVNTDMVVKGDRIPTPGETVTGGQFVMAHGGKGANQAVAAARLGAEVILVAKVGDDVFGEESIENFRREGISTEFILRDPRRATGLALILVNTEGENSISIAPGANFHLAPDEVEQALERIGPADVVLLQLEIPLEASRRAAEFAHAVGACVILDPAPAAPLDDDFIQQVDYLTPNESEAQLLTGQKVDNDASARLAVNSLLGQGARNVILTLGAAGVLSGNSQEMRTFSSPSADVRDTTAAGDAFNGGLAYALASGEPLDRAITYATRVAALAVTKLGAQPSLPTAEEVQEFVAATRSSAGAEV
jgi:ribokinase